MWVAPRARGTGLGRRILEELERQASNGRCGGPSTRDQRRAERGDRTVSERWLRRGAGVQRRAVRSPLVREAPVARLIHRSPSPGQGFEVSRMAASSSLDGAGKAAAMVRGRSRTIAAWWRVRGSPRTTKMGRSSPVLRLAPANASRLEWSSRMISSRLPTRVSTSIKTMARGLARHRSTERRPAPGTAASTRRRQKGPAIVRIHSTIGAWARSRTSGPDSTNAEIRRSAPSTVATRNLVRSVMPGSPASRRLSTDRATPTSRARAPGSGPIGSAGHAAPRPLALTDAGARAPLRPTPFD